MPSDELKNRELSLPWRALGGGRAPENLVTTGVSNKTLANITCF